MTTQSLVFKITAPTNGLAYEAMPTPDFVDAFQLEWSGKGAQTPTELARQLFQRAPRWIVALLQLRNWLGRLVGLASTLPPDPATANAPLQPGMPLGPFRVFATTTSEVLLGLNDRHLNFRVAVHLLPPTTIGGQATVTTVVCLHNLLGRWYFALIRPIHERLVPALLRHNLR